MPSRSCRPTTPRCCGSSCLTIPARTRCVAFSARRRRATTSTSRSSTTTHGARRGSRPTSPGRCRSYAPYAWAVSVGNEQDIVSKQRLAQGAPRTARVVHRHRTPAALPAHHGRVLPAGVERGRASGGSCRSEGSARVRGDLALGVRLPEGQLRDGTATRRAGGRLSLLRHEVGRPPGRPAGRSLGRQVPPSAVVL